MRRGTDDVLGAALDAELGCFAHGACRGNHVIDHDHGLAFHVADDVVRDHLAARLTAFIDDRQIAADPVGVTVGHLHVADVGTDEHEIAKLFANGIEILDDDRGGMQVIDGDIEEALDLFCVHVQRQHAISTGSGDQIGDEFRSDRHPAGILAILPGVTHIRQHRCDATGAGALEAIDVNQKLHQVRIDRMIGRLHDEAIAATHILFDLHEDFAIGKHIRMPLPHRQVEVTANGLRQRHGSAAGENLQSITIRATHGNPCQRSEVRSQRSEKAENRCDPRVFLTSAFDACADL